MEVALSVLESVEVINYSNCHTVVHFAMTKGSITLAFGLVALDAYIQMTSW